MAVLIPTTSPSRLMSGPPEFPWLMATSVWRTPRKCSIWPFSPSEAEMLLDKPDTIPLETVLENIPRALPIAITVCPNSSFEELQSRTTGKPFACIFRTAMSLIGSRDITLAGYSWSSVVSTVYSASGSKTTCLLVRRRPSGWTMNPEPPPTFIFSFAPSSISPKKKGLKNGAGEKLLIWETYFDITILTTDGATFLTDSMDRRSYSELLARCACEFIGYFPFIIFQFPISIHLSLFHLFISGNTTMVKW